MKTPKYQHEVIEVFCARKAVNDVISGLRARYGNKDGRAPDGEYRRYEEQWLENIEKALDEVMSKLFAIERQIEKDGGYEEPAKTPPNCPSCGGEAEFADGDGKRINCFHCGLTNYPV